MPPRFGRVQFGWCLSTKDWLYSACCQNGLSIAHGTGSGILAAESATGYGSNLLEILQRQPKILPPQPFDWLCVNARMRWGEFKAGKEL